MSEGILALALGALIVVGTVETTAAPQPREAGDFWAFRPPRAASPPVVLDAAWPQTAIDRWVLARLESAGLAPAGRATREALVRRLFLDLIGLPPGPAEVGEFVADPDPTPVVMARWADRLLESPHYGERWGRWWLDVARYADTNGQDENKVMANAWRYRDWVVRAFNANRRFDTFIVEQIAGDLLEPVEDEAVQADRLIATGFLVLGPKMLAEQDKEKLVLDVIDEQIDTVGRAFLGLTLGCARCHDHKFDPVPARDYYALAGIFRSTRTMENLAFVSKFNERPVGTREEAAARETHARVLSAATNAVLRLVQETEAALKSAGVEIPGEDARRVYPPAAREQLMALEVEVQRLQANPPPAPRMALAVAEASPVNVPVLMRGNHLQPGPTPVPRGFVEVLGSWPGMPRVPESASGRLELARWLVARENPLTARVIVNRVWQAHFGEGLVRTPENFGWRGEPPSHPELLDDLAVRWMASGWDLKALHREIVLSATYQQASVAGDMEAAVRRDPENRWLHRFPRRRLEAEMLRDAVLRVAGRLDTATGGSLVNWKNDDYAPGDEVSATSTRRSVYLPIVRDRVYDGLTLFDFANPSVCTVKRTPTVVSQQALFFLNSPLVTKSAETLAEDLQRRHVDDPTAQVAEAYRRVLGRNAGTTEIARAVAFLEEVPRSTELTDDTSATQRREALAAFCQVLLSSNEFAYLP